MIFLDLLSFIAFFAGAISVLYQMVYLLVGIIGKPVVFKDAPYKKYAVIVSARNEEAVLHSFLNSVNKQNYPSELLDKWVIADNCSDNTAQIARENGANVLVRNNKKEIGKGYALSFLFDYLFENDLVKNYDGFFIFDADNTLKDGYFIEMNKAFSHGYDLVTSYRNSKNLSSNWVSAGSALWFIRESRLVNNSRQIIGVNSHVGGTGFMFSRKVIEENKGWHFHLLTEDLQFTMDSVIKGYKIGYCGSAIFYDEQPISFLQSWRQRLRWAKGFLQVFRNYGSGLIEASMKHRNFSYLDLTILIFPWMFLSIVRILFGILFSALGFVSLYSQVDYLISILYGNLLSMVVMSVLAMITVLVERENIEASNLELLVYCLTFPIFIISYVPISFAALFLKVEWKPIVHKGIGVED